LLKEFIQRDFMPSFYSKAEIHLDIVPPSQQNMFTLADFQKFAGFEADWSRCRQKPSFEVIQRREENKLARRRAVALLTAV
jgi:hypothetical protein